MVLFPLFSFSLFSFTKISSEQTEFVSLRFEGIKNSIQNTSSLYFWKINVFFLSKQFAFLPLENLISIDDTIIIDGQFLFYGYNKTKLTFINGNKWF